MEYKYQGTGDLEGLILESALPMKDWKYGTEVLVYSDQPERLSPENARNSICDSLNSMET